MTILNENKIKFKWIHFCKLSKTTIMSLFFLRHNMLYLIVYDMIYTYFIVYCYNIIQILYYVKYIYNIHEKIELNFFFVNGEVISSRRYQISFEETRVMSDSHKLKAPRPRCPSFADFNTSKCIIYIFLRSIQCLKILVWSRVSSYK